MTKFPILTKRRLRLLSVVIGLFLLGMGVLPILLHAQGSLSNQVLALLTRVNSWTATNTFVDLRVANQAIPSTTTYRIYADPSGNLYFNGGLIAGSGGGVTPHNWLSTTHADTVASSPVRGAVVVANATPAWAKVQPSVTGSMLLYNGTDTVFGTSAAALTAIPAAQITGTASAFGGNAITNLNATQLLTGTVPLARLSGITTTEISASAAIPYSKLTLTAGILNTDVSASAAIAYAKLNLASAIVTGDITNGTILFADWSANGCTSSQVARYDGANWVCRTLVAADISGGGTVTSAAISAPGIFTVAGSPITTAGTLALSLATQVKNLVWAGPTTGADAAPTFRTLAMLISLRRGLVQVPTLSSRLTRLDW